LIIGRVSFEYHGDTQTGTVYVVEREGSASAKHARSLLKIAFSFPFAAFSSCL